MFCSCVYNAGLGKYACMCVESMCVCECGREHLCASARVHARARVCECMYVCMYVCVTNCITN